MRDAGMIKVSREGRSMYQADRPSGLLIPYWITITSTEGEIAQHGLILPITIYIVKTRMPAQIYLIKIHQQLV